jgi:hypothetical protein
VNLLVDVLHGENILVSFVGYLLLTGSYWVESAKRFACFVKHSNFVVFRCCLKVALFETVNNDVDNLADKPVRL